jgi:hypothetical protein
VRRLARPAAAALVLLAAGCGSPGSPGGSAPRPAPEVTAAGAPQLATSLVTAVGTWAVAVTGGSAAAHDNFWQLFVRPAGSTMWRLVTPPGVPDNGGLVAAGAGGRSLITGFRPSQYLTYTPLAITRDGGQAWSPAGPLAGALANAPDALAAAPNTGRLLALLTSGTVVEAAPGYTSWHRLVSRHTLAATPAARPCDLRNITAVTWAAPGMPLIGASCARPGVAGILALSQGAWRNVAPAMPTVLARQPVTVLRLTEAGGRAAALLQAGSGPGASLLAAWSAGGRRWTLSAPLRARATVTAASVGPVQTIVLNGTTATVIPDGRGSWRRLPAVPSGTATVTAGPAGGFDTLAVHRSKLTVWRLAAGGVAWQVAQAIIVPIQYGSSG